MAIDPIIFREHLSEGFLKLIDSKRGVASNLAKSIGKPPGFINEIRRGKPVNALHLKAVSIVFGAQVLLDLMAIDDLKIGVEQKIEGSSRSRDIEKRLADLEKRNPKVFDMVATYITGAHEAAKAAASNWEEIEKGGRRKDEVDFNTRKQGTNE